MSDGALSRWDGLSLVKRGFVHSFAPAVTREWLLKEAHSEVYRLVQASPFARS
jgi:hypothetical protein